MKTVECDSLPLESAGSFLSVLELDVSDGKSGDLELVRRVPPSVSVPIIGRLVGFTDSRVPLVAFIGDDAAEATAARTTVAMSPGQIGSEVVLTFAGGDRNQPIILGCLIDPAARAPDSAPAQAPQPVHVELNGQRLELTAQEEIVLRCGKASITLTKAGKVLIRGEYLLSRSSGVNRIKGGSVQIN
jgi:hypothetical protein